jgi:ribonuclease P protein component
VLHVTDQHLTSNGFGRNLRLLTAPDYQAVFSQAEFKVSRPQLLILAIRHGNVNPRLGLVIAKKNIRLAVQRNRVKRLIRESFRHHQHLLTGLDIVILARKGLDAADNAATTQLLETLWQDLVRRHKRQATR